MIHDLSTKKGRNTYIDAKPKKVSANITKVYPENSICILNKESLQIKDTQFKANTNYRVSFDEDKKGCLVYGEWMTIQRFEANFVLYIPLLQERLKKLGLIVNGKPVSYKEFVDRCNVFGRGYINVYIYFHPKENMFSFYPMGTTTKIEGLKTCYQTYLKLVQGDMDVVDFGYVKWSNCGLPLGGGFPRRDEFNCEILKNKLGYINY